MALILLAIIAEIESGKRPNVIYRLGGMLQSTKTDPEVQANLRHAIELVFAKNGRM